MSKHLDQTRIHNSQLVVHRIERDWVDYIGDDKAFQYGLTVKRSEEDLKWGEPTFNFKLEDDGVLINGNDFEGGIFVLSSIKPHCLQRALAMGLQYMMNSGQLGCDDYFDNNGHEVEG